MDNVRQFEKVSYPSPRSARTGRFDCAATGAKAHRAAALGCDLVQVVAKNKRDVRVEGIALDVRADQNAMHGVLGSGVRQLGREIVTESGLLAFGTIGIDALFAIANVDHKADARKPTQGYSGQPAQLVVQPVVGRGNDARFAHAMPSLLASL